jgi:hypothetical protein
MNELVAKEKTELTPGSTNEPQLKSVATRRGFFADALSGVSKATYERSLEAGGALDLTDNLSLVDATHVDILLRVKDNDTVGFRKRLLKHKRRYEDYVAKMRIAKDANDKVLFDEAKVDASLEVDHILRLIEVGGTEAEATKDLDMVTKQKAILHDQQLKYEKAVYETKSEMLKDGSLVSAFNFFVSLIEAIERGKLTASEAMTEAGKWKSSLG